MRRLTGRDAAIIAIYIVFTALIGLGAGVAFGYGYPEAGFMFSIAAAMGLFITGVEVKVRREDQS